MNTVSIVHDTESKIAPGAATPAPVSPLHQKSTKGRSGAGGSWMDPKKTELRDSLDVDTSLKSSPTDRATKKSEEMA